MHAAEHAMADESDTVHESLQLELNQLQLPGYEFTDKIGEGGMASVYKGRQLSLSRPVAIKVLNQQMRKHDQVYEAFEREAVIIARLNHPNIIHVIDRGISDSGAPFFIMEFIDGVDLATLMREGRLPLQKKIEICLQICKALSYAHKNGVIHRDVKPANVLVDGELNAKVLDFGIALFFKGERNKGESFKGESYKSESYKGENSKGEDSEEEICGGDGHEDDAGIQDGSERDIMGTYNYMAPELSASAAKATFNSDIYSLGVIMYELFAGHLPNQQQRLKPPKETGLPPSIAALVMSCLAPDPQQRPRSMIEVHDRLLQLLHGSHLDKKQVQRANDVIKRKTFSLLDVISEHRNGSVYLFIEKNSGQQFVVKKMVGQFQGYDTGRRLAKISHPNIARVHGASKNDRACIVVMDYLKGGSLQDRLARPYPLVAFLPVARQIAQGLLYAHSQQILHGNLRPGNILFDDNDRIKIADFGIKQLFDEEEQNFDAKKRKENPANYRLPQEPLCPQADIYACGVIFHLLLIGNLPRFHNMEFQPGRAFKRLPQALRDLLEKMLKIHVVERPNDMQEVIQVLNQFSTDMPTQVWSADNTVKDHSNLAPQGRRRRQRLLVVVFLVLVVVVNLGLIAFFEPVNSLFSPWFERLADLLSD